MNFCDSKHHISCCASLSAASVQCRGVSLWQRSGSLSQGPNGENFTADFSRYSEVPEHADEAGDRKETTGWDNTAAFKNVSISCISS